jgi:hypothetical protein
VAGTPLLTPDGAKAVECLRPGDLILSRAEEDVVGAVESKAVEEVFVRVALVLALQVQGRVIRTTSEHPFYVCGRGWVSACYLCAGDLLASHDGQAIAVERVAETREVATVYNVRVADYHTYFVGSREWGFSVWAHNAYEIRWNPASVKWELVGPDGKLVLDLHLQKPLASTHPEHVKALAEAQGITDPIYYRNPNTGQLQFFEPKQPPRPAAIRFPDWKVGIVDPENWTTS